MAADKESLSSAFQKCRQSFDAVLGFPSAQVESAVSSKLAWEDEASRLRLWGSNIGAAQSKANTSLDFRLRDADAVRQQIHKNLSNLNEALQEGLECMQDIAQDKRLLDASLDENSNTCGNASSTDVVQASSVSQQVFSRSEDDGDGMENSVEDLQASFEDVVSLINSLFRMTLYIRNPSRRDQLKHRDNSAVANFEAFDISHIENKFPRADILLARRLGQANTVRRANLRYWERHHKKLAYDETVNDEVTVAPLSESVATTFQPIQEETHDTRSHFSGTSYMSSMLGGQSIRRPDLPEAGKNGAPFQCPICCYIVTVSGQREWMKHVFFDLQPYVCIFTDCKTPLLLYENRRDWFDHVMSKHLSDSRPPSQMQQMQCPLCREDVRSLALIRRHLARHLEEVALFSLPNSLFGEEKEMVDDDRAGDYSSENDTADASPLPQDTLILEPFDDPHPTSKAIKTSLPDTPRDGNLFTREGAVVELPSRGAEVYSDPRIDTRAKDGVEIFSRDYDDDYRSKYNVVLGTGIDFEHIRTDIEALDRVLKVHHLRVWQLSDTNLVASLRVKVDCEIEGSGSGSYMHLAHKIRQCLHSYGIHSSTIQPELPITEEATVLDTINTNEHDVASENASPGGTNPG